MVIPKWRVDGIPGFDSIIRKKGKLYKKWTVVDARDYRGLPAARAKAQKKLAGGGGIIARVHNTYQYAVYTPYFGAQRPIVRVDR